MTKKFGLICFILAILSIAFFWGNLYIVQKSRFCADSNIKESCHTPIHFYNIAIEILSSLFVPISFILGIIGIIKSKEDKKEKIFSIIGMILSIINFLAIYLYFYLIASSLVL
jgi:uncharacterized membrane protein